MWLHVEPDSKSDSTIFATLEDAVVAARYNSHLKLFLKYGLCWRKQEDLESFEFPGDYL